MIPEAVMEEGVKEYVAHAPTSENAHYVNAHDEKHACYMNILQTITDPVFPHQERELNLHMYYC